MNSKEMHNTPRSGGEPSYLPVVVLLFMLVVGTVLWFVAVDAV